jgi:ABC-type sugar transport system substrate-binding protein
LIFINFLFAKEYLVGFAQDTLNNDWRLAQVKEVENEIKKYPYLKLIVKNANTEISKQIRDIEDFIDMGVDFIITSPINSKITPMVLKKALNKNIKVILIDRGIETQDYTAFVEPDNYKIGEESAKYIINLLNKKGTILMLEGVKGATPTTLRSDGFMNIANQYKDIKVIKRSADYLRNRAIMTIEDIYNQNIEFDAIFSQSDSMLIGAREVMKKKDIDMTKIIMVGVDYINAAKTAIESNTQTASFLYPTCGKEGVKLIVNIISGKNIKKYNLLDIVMIDKNNIEDMRPIF